MKVVVDALPPEGRTVRATVSDSWLFDSARRSIEAKPRSLSCVLTVKKVPVSRDPELARTRAPRFVVDGELSVEWRQACHRCVRSLKMDLQGPVSLTYVRGALEDSDEVELESTDLDIGWFEGGSLDLADVVSEQLALWLPERVVCDDAHSSRIATSDDGACQLHQQDAGPDLRRQTPFSGLANWKPPQ